MFDVQSGEVFVVLSERCLVSCLERYCCLVWRGVGYPVWRSICCPVRRERFVVLSGVVLSGEVFVVLSGEVYVVLSVEKFVVMSAEVFAVLSGEKGLLSCLERCMLSYL